MKMYPLSSGVYEEVVALYESGDGFTYFDLKNDLYYYWDAPIEEIYYWRDAFPKVDCMCEICFDIANEEKKIIWADH